MFLCLLCVVRFYCKALCNPVLKGAIEIKVIVIIIIVTSFPPTDYALVYILSPLMNRCVMTDPVETSELSPVAPAWHSLAAPYIWLQLDKMPALI